MDTYDCRNIPLLVGLLASNSALHQTNFRGKFVRTHHRNYLLTIGCWYRLFIIVSNCDFTFTSIEKQIIVESEVFSNRSGVIHLNKKMFPNDVIINFCVTKKN